MSAPTVAVRERPILFSAPMVRALLDGTKTQTRRVLVPQPNAALDYAPGPRLRSREVTGWNCVGTDVRTGRWVYEANDANRQPVNAFRDGAHSVKAEIACPFGQPGDRLWVRETWGRVPFTTIIGPLGRRTQTVYRAGKRMGVPVPGTTPVEFNTEWRDDFAPDRWRPSIHMPRWVSRITLELTGVRVERLHDISEDDARAEGVAPCFTRHIHYDGQAFRCEYQHLWDSLNAKRGFGWFANPWVWVLDFRTVQPPEELTNG